MKPITLKVAESLNITQQIWTIELTDLGVHQAFMGYSLSDKYLMIGITSPRFENQISINSMPKDKSEVLRVPIYLEKCDCGLFGELNFKGLESILIKWKLYFYDSRFGKETEVIEGKSISVKRLEKNIRSEHLRLIGYSKKQEQADSLFELRLKAKN